MLGRRGSYALNLFTNLVVGFASLFGSDAHSEILLTYLLFVAIWQRELETPSRNEVEELDFVRGTLGITVALLVALVLLPI